MLFLTSPMAFVEVTSRPQLLPICRSIIQY